MNRVAPTTARSKGLVPAALSTGRNHEGYNQSRLFIAGASPYAAPLFRPLNSGSAPAQNPVAASSWRPLRLPPLLIAAEFSHLAAVWKPPWAPARSKPQARKSRRTPQPTKHMRLRETGRD